MRGKAVKLFMLPAQRQARIMQQLQENGFVAISELSAQFGADRSTIRRDLRELELRGVVRRTRGGAMAGPASGLADIPYAAKRLEHTAEKQAIGHYVARLVHQGDAILLDSGSTTLQIALALRKREGISVVTNDLNIAMALSDSSGIQLVVTGGILLESVYALVGPTTVDGLRQLNVDRVYLGADAIHHETGITNMTFVEVEVKRAMIAAAREVVAVADSSKFEHRALAPICGMEEIDLLVTDSNLPFETRGLYGHRLLCVGIDGESQEDSRHESDLHQLPYARSSHAVAAGDNDPLDLSTTPK